MKLSRRTFAMLAFAAGAVAPFAVARSRIVPLEDVWIGYGPVLGARLRGSLLTVERRAPPRSPVGASGRAAAFHRGRFIGFLPPGVAGPMREVRVATADFDDDGRLRVTVRV